MAQVASENKHQALRRTPVVNYGSTPFISELDSSASSSDSPSTGLRKSLDDYFRISERDSDIGTEVRAGVVNFLTMAYILLANPQVGSIAPFSSIRPNQNLNWSGCRQPS